MIKKICDAVSTAIIVIAVVIFALLYAGNLFGVKTYSVLSGSMEPHIHTGSVVYVKITNAENIKEGDVITFKNPDMISVTHRVVKIKESEKQFITKGDANESEDGPCDFDSLIGRVVLTVPYLGFIAVWMSTAVGKCILICLFAAAIILVTISEIIFKKSA